MEKLYPEACAEITWEYKDSQCSIVKNQNLGHYCGYVRFKKKPLKSEGYDDFATYIPAHGGLTYAKQDKNGYVYGFDCMHPGDKENQNLQNINWLKMHCEYIADAIIDALPYETEYLKNADNEKRSQIIEQYWAKMKTNLSENGNMGVMINLLGGKL